ncbi:MAG: CHRD domain-containing protein [Gaiellaceae bacterium]
MAVNRRLLAVLVLVAALALLVVSTPAGATGETTKCTAYAVLKADNEVPPSGSKAFGAALVHVNGTKLSFSVAIVNPARESFFAGHIHVGAAGVNGPVQVLLFSGSTDRRLIVQAARLDISETLAAAICADPAGYYVNYHTTDFPGGAVRGQLNEV